MGHFITGATGFIGRFLVAELLQRGEPVYVLTRAGSKARLEQAMSFWGARARRVTPITGDLAEPALGVAADSVAQLRGHIRHVFHLGALYDLDANAAELERANVLGTRNALDFAASVQAGCFHLASSVATAGRYAGTFTEDMFAEAEGLDHPYFRTKHESEALVRGERRVPWRIYRPGMVVGNSRTGQMDKIDGPYYFFKPIQKLRRIVPEWVPLVGFEGGHINIVPVDFVAAAMAYLAHLPELAGGALTRLEDYAWRLWDYWERHLDPDLFVDRSLRGAVGGRTVLITGGSSGIGRATATRLGAFAQLMSLFAPRVSELIMSEAFKLFPESEAAGGQREVRPSKEMITFASILRGIHW